MTPATIDLKRGSDYTIEITKPGYQPQTQVLNSHFDHWLEATLGNIWNYIIPGLIVDAIDGRAEEFDKKMIHVELNQAQNQPIQPISKPKPAKKSS